MGDNFLGDILSGSFVPTMCSAADALREIFPEDFDPEFDAKYHEVGIVKEGNSITSAIIKEGTVLDDTEWQYVSYDNFISLVKAKEIKYLKWDINKNRMILWKAEINSNIENITSVDSYFKHDVIFNCKPSKDKIPCAICNILQYNKVDTITMLMASGDKTEKLFQIVEQFTTVPPKPKRYYNSIEVIVPFNQFKDFVSKLDINGYKVSYCMESAENFTLRHAYQSKIPKHFRESPEFVYEQVRRMI